MGKDSALGEGYVAKHLAQLVVISNSEHDVARCDALLLVITSHVASQFQNLRDQVLDGSSDVDSSTFRTIFEVR